MATRRETRPQKEKELANENESGWHDSQLERHRLVIACVRGNVSVRETLRTILRDALPSDSPPPLLVLGPTAPEEICNGQSNRIGWVTFVGGSSMAHPSSHVEINSPESFYSFFCQLASRVKLKKRTAILVIKEDIHDRSVVETVKRFADLVLEFRDQDNNGTLKVEMRTLNFADNVYTAWRPFSDWLQPLSMTG